ncbi:hypothetical protein CYMTET_36514 [Cymbomonas tetramitiformis]|uniref:DNA topoisomerase 2 n=1 Tax=Cymbomonas tetramitiformis TaxID=36881 RepID=A0AAE0CFT1_9CHLO|nr:hypothetical protein CYMTET_36514 [Cymbomonas tetramitiformis]
MILPNCRHNLSSIRFDPAFALKKATTNLRVRRIVTSVTPSAQLWNSSSHPIISFPKRVKHICSSTAIQAADNAQDNGNGSGYDAGQIQVLEGLEAVRRRPGMYIGNTGNRGLHQLLYEVVDNAIDEVQGGHATHVEVELEACGAIRVSDNGRGIPTDLHPTTGVSALETVLTVLHAGGKFGGESSGYQVSGGLHGVGISVVNALSSELQIAVCRRGKQVRQHYARGKPVSKLQDEPTTMESGTEVRFVADPEIFSKTNMEAQTITSRLRELAYLNSTAHITLQLPSESPEEAAPAVQSFHYPNGLLEYVTYLNRDNEVLHEPISFERDIDGVHVEVAMQWCKDNFSDTLLGYANSIRTIDGGSHIDGMKMALTRTINSLARKQKLLKVSPLLMGPRTPRRNPERSSQGISICCTPCPGGAVRMRVSIC